jgi:hypothetical protein
MATGGSGKILNIVRQICWCLAVHKQHFIERQQIHRTLKEDYMAIRTKKRLTSW